MSSFKIITIQCAERDMLPTTHLGPIDHDCVRLMDLCVRRRDVAPENDHIQIHFALSAEREREAKRTAWRDARSRPSLLRLPEENRITDAPFVRRRETRNVGVAVGVFQPRPQNGNAPLRRRGVLGARTSRVRACCGNVPRPGAREQERPASGVAVRRPGASQRERGADRG